MELMDISMWYFLIFLCRCRIFGATQFSLICSKYNVSLDIKHKTGKAVICQSNFPNEFSASAFIFYRKNSAKSLTCSRIKCDLCG